MHHQFLLESSATGSRLPVNGFKKMSALSVGLGLGCVFAVNDRPGFNATVRQLPWYIPWFFPSILTLSLPQPVSSGICSRTSCEELCTHSALASSMAEQSFVALAPFR